MADCDGLLERIAECMNHEVALVVIDQAVHGFTEEEADARMEQRVAAGDSRHCEKCPFRTVEYEPLPTPKPPALRGILNTPGITEEAPRG